jgi:hypothetical protein
LCHPVAHFVPSRGTFCAFPWHMVFCSLLSIIASQELQVKNCKSRIAKKSIFDSLDIFFSRLNE